MKEEPSHTMPKWPQNRPKTTPDTTITKRTEPSKDLNSSKTKSKESSTENSTNMQTRTGKKFKNTFDYTVKDIRAEENSGELITQPNMTISLKELLKRYVRGGEVATFQPVYQEGDDFDDSPDLMKMDALEKLEYAKQIKQTIAETQKRLNTEIHDPKTNDFVPGGQSIKPEPEKKADPTPTPTPEPQPLK